jgi:hypothetical protein
LVLKRVNSLIAPRVTSKHGHNAHPSSSLMEPVSDSAGRPVPFRDSRFGVPMTRDDWLTCSDPTVMLNFLRDTATGRKLRLFACAWGRDVWRHLSDERSRDAIFTAERFADGEVTFAELLAAHRDAADVCLAISLTPGRRRDSITRRQADRNWGAKASAEVARHTADPEWDARTAACAVAWKQGAIRYAMSNHLRDIFTRLERLARTNQTAILEHFRSWQHVPDAVRADPSAIQGYVHCMVAIAQTFAEKLGRPELMAVLAGPPQSNPLAKWQATLRQTRELMDALRYPEARAILTDALIDSRGMSGTGVDTYLPITHGYVAEAHFQSGAADQAVPHLEQALALCERSGDAEGIAAYLGSLFETHRYLGQGERAAGYADRMTALLDTQGATRDAARWRTRARIVRASEPLNRVVAVVDGATFEMDEVRPTGDMRAIRLRAQPDHAAAGDGSHRARRGTGIGWAAPGGARGVSRSGCGGPVRSPLSLPRSVHPAALGAVYGRGGRLPTGVGVGSGLVPVSGRPVGGRATGPRTA